jgi:Tol biopolymer transport system component
MRLRDMGTGTEKVLSTGPAKPKISPDGANVAYLAGTVGLGPIFLMPSSGGEATKLLEQEGGVRIYGWSVDGKKIVYWHGAPVRFSVFDLETRQTAELISHPTYDIHGAELSPDGNWVAFHLPRPVSEPLKIAPVREGKAAAEAEWMTVTDTVGTNRRPWWSPDGNLLYFVSSRDNYQCIWAQPLDPATKRPRGEPMAVYHSHEARRMLNPLGGAPAMGGGRMVFALSEQSGNIWLAERAAAER